MSAIGHPVSADVALSTSPDSVPAPRLWPGVALVIAYWGFVIASRVLDLPIFGVFMSNMAASVLLTLLFVIWWLTNRRVKGAERLFAFGALLVCGALAALLCDPSVGPMGIMLFGAPISVTAWSIWLLLTRKSSPALKRLGLLALFIVSWGSLTLVRVDGVWGDNNATVSSRWSPSAEDKYLAQRAQSHDAAPVAEALPGEPLVLESGDWPEFRGPNREGEVHGVTFATDWGPQGPKELWRNRIGPAWSSVVIIGDRLFTQEQRGADEVVVCLDAKTGRELWIHADHTRYSDGQAGAGPRATPTFFEGRIYTQGASGVLNCLDAATGKLVWSRNLITDSGAPLPMWGFSSSPLVVQGIVIAYAGAKEDKGLLAYRTTTGEPAWTAPTGPVSYSSPQLATLGGQQQVLFFSDLGLISVEPETGTRLWQYDASAAGLWRVVQPRQFGDDTVLIGCEDLGLVRLEVKHVQNSWTPTERWKSKAIRAAYNDFVISEGFVYGFDEGIFCCVDLETGKRRWKAGRYGHGQVLLVADQHLLVVVSESGEVILVKASTEGHEELARFQAVKGKTWNHPVVAHGRLFVRNDEELACFELAPLAAP